jgi:hypothetical protein
MVMKSSKFCVLISPHPPFGHLLPMSGEKGINEESQKREKDKIVVRD